MIYFLDRFLVFCFSYIISYTIIPLFYSLYSPLFSHGFPGEYMGLALYDSLELEFCSSRTE